MLEFNPRNFRYLVEQNSQLKEKLKCEEEKVQSALKEYSRFIEENESHRILIHQQQSIITTLEQTINAQKLELASLKGSTALTNQYLNPDPPIIPSLTPSVSLSSIEPVKSDLSSSTKPQAQQMSSLSSQQIAQISLSSKPSANSSTTDAYRNNSFNLDPTLSRYCSAFNTTSRDESLCDLTKNQSHSRVGSPKNNSQPSQLLKKTPFTQTNNSKSLAPLSFQNTLGSKKQQQQSTDIWAPFDDSLQTSTQWIPQSAMNSAITSVFEQELPKQQIKNQQLTSRQQQQPAKSVPKQQPSHNRSGSCIVGLSTPNSVQQAPQHHQPTASTQAAPRLGSSASQSNYSSLTVLKSALFSQSQPMSQSGSQKQLLGEGQSRKINHSVVNKKDQIDRPGNPRSGATTPVSSVQMNTTSTCNIQNASFYASVGQGHHHSKSLLTGSNSCNKENGNNTQGTVGNKLPDQKTKSRADEQSVDAIKGKTRSNRSTVSKSAVASVASSASTASLAVTNTISPSPLQSKVIQTNTASISPTSENRSTSLQVDSVNETIAQASNGKQQHQEEDGLGIYRVQKKEPAVLKKPTGHSFFRSQTSTNSQTFGSVSSSIDYNQYKIQRKLGGSQTNISASQQATATTTIDLSRNSSLSQQVVKGMIQQITESNNPEHLCSKERMGNIGGYIPFTKSKLAEDENYLTLNEEQPLVNCNYFSTKPGQLHSLLPPSSRQEELPQILTIQNAKDVTVKTAQPTTSITTTLNLQTTGTLGGKQQYSIPSFYSGTAGDMQSPSLVGMRCDTSGTCDISFAQPHQMNSNLEFKVKCKSSSNLNKEPGKLKQHLEGAAGFGKVRAESIYQKEPVVIAERIFESFYVFGVDKNHINKNINTPQLLTPKVQMRFPQDQVYSENRENVLPLFAFPKGVETQRVRMSDSLSQMNEVVYANYVVENNPNCFTFVIKSDDSFKKVHETSAQSNPLLAHCNPSRLLYGVCFKINDLIEDTPTAINQQTPPGFWVSKKALCFVTYYPFFKFFFDIISYFLNQLKMERIKSDNIDNPSMTDTHLLMKVMTSTGIDLLKSLQSLATPSINSTVKLYYMQNSFEYVIQNSSRARYIEAEESSSIMFSSMPCETFVRIFLSVLTEQPVVVVSQNSSLLSAVILFVYSLLKPLKWPHPLICSLPDSLIHLLDSPVPIFVGLNMPKQEVLSKGLLQRHENCSFVLLDDPSKRVESYHNDFAQLTKNSHLYARFMEALQPLFNEISLTKGINLASGLAGSQSASNLRKTTRAASAIFSTTTNSSRFDTITSKNLAGSTSTAVTNDLGQSIVSRASNHSTISPVEREKEISIQLISTVSRVLQQEILNHLPPKTKTGSKQDVIDIDQIEQHIRNKIPKFDSDPLLFRVIHTQMFSYFLEEYYFESLI